MSPDGARGGLVGVFVSCPLSIRNRWILMQPSDPVGNKPHTSGRLPSPHKLHFPEDVIGSTTI